jgi:hypothetical protein
MRLGKIGGTNFMGADFELPLEELNIIYGPNFSGKSRIKRAIELSLLGYAPGLDKRPADIFRLSSGREMEVRAELATETIKTPGSEETTYHALHRSWKLATGGTVKVKHHVPEFMDGATPLVMLDAGDYFGRSARGRVELVFATAKAESITAGSVKDALDGIAKVTDNETANEICRHAGGKAVSTQEWFSVAAETAEQLRSEASASVRRYGGTIQGLSALQLDEKAPQRSLEAIDAELTKLHEHLGWLKAQKEKAEKQANEAEQRELEYEQLRHKIALAGDPIPRDYNIKELREKAETLGKRLVELRAKEFTHSQWLARKNDFVPTTTCPTCRRPLDEPFMEFLEPEPEKPDGVTLAVVEFGYNEVCQQLDEYTRTLDVQAWRRRLKELETGTLILKLEPIELEIASAKQAVDRLELERRIAESDRNDRKRLAEAQAEHAKAVEAEARYKEAKKFLLAEKEKLIAQVFGPLLETANALADGIARAPFEYRDGEFGYTIRYIRDDGPLHSTPSPTRWVSEETFSGTEQALLYASLQAALGAQSPCRVVVVDELADMDDRKFLLFLVNVAAVLGAGKIDQFVGLTPRLSHADQLRGMGLALIEARGDSYSTT